MWLEVVERATKFLRFVSRDRRRSRVRLDAPRVVLNRPSPSASSDIHGSASTKGNIPLQDQHLALAILLELAVQRGTLR